jgi:hypothetical protein
MSLQQQERIKSLEARVEVLEGVIRQLVDCPKPSVTVADLCPKCGVKPNKYFHTRSCTGK